MRSVECYLKWTTSLMPSTCSAFSCYFSHCLSVSLSLCLPLICAPLKFEFFVCCQQKYHRDVLEQIAPPSLVAVYPSPPPLTSQTLYDEPPIKLYHETSPEGTTSVPVRKVQPRRIRRSSSRRHRKVSAGGRDIHSS